MPETLNTWLQWARREAKTAGVALNKHTRLNLDNGVASIYEHVFPVKPTGKDANRLKEWERIERAVELDAQLFRTTEGMKAFDRVKVLQAEIQEKLDAEQFYKQINAPLYREPLPEYWKNFYPDPIGGTYRLNYLMSILKQAETLCKEAVLKYNPYSKRAQIYSPDRPTLKIYLNWTGEYTGR